LRYLPLLLLLAGCAIGPYADTPRYKAPDTRTTAARQLNEALAFAGIGLSEVAADEVRLTWHERPLLNDKRRILLERELSLQGIKDVSRPKRPGEWWEVRVEGAGGLVTFEFRSGPAAAKAETALQRLMQPVTRGEGKELAKRYLAQLEGRLPYFDDSTGVRRHNADWASPEQAAGSLRALTGQDFGRDIDAWRDWLRRAYGL